MVRNLVRVTTCPEIFSTPRLKILFSDWCFCESIFPYFKKSVTTSFCSWSVQRYRSSAQQEIATLLRIILLKMSLVIILYFTSDLHSIGFLNKFTVLVQTSAIISQCLQTQIWNAIYCCYLSVLSLFFAAFKKYLRGLIEISMRFVCVWWNRKIVEKLDFLESQNF